MRDENQAFDAERLAHRLQAAWTERRPIEPFSETGDLTSPEQAYATQQAWARLRAQDGETTVGRKIGLTSPGMQRQMGVDEPDYGDLWGSRQAIADDGLARFDHGVFLQPRIEGEIAFLLGSDLEGPGVTPDAVRAAAVAAAPALEIVDSRIADWRIKLVDTIADDASYGGFALGAWSERLLAADLAAVECSLHKGDEEIMRERGTAVLGSPLLAVAWLADKLTSLGSGIRAGDIVLSGSFAGAVPAHATDTFTLRTAGEAELSVHFD
ncbi:MAG: 2-keto-4-pentenoate hydratase [Solirubrobacteraceae bacterium]